MLKPPLDHFGILAPFYERFIPPRVPEKLIALLEMPSGGALLDAGGGTGRVSQFLHNQTARILIADQSMDMLRQAHQKEGLQPVRSESEHMPFPAKYFDRIIMVDALHHMANQIYTAQELWRILQPGGRIVIEEPDIRSWEVKLIALGEKLALMRSHFLSPSKIADLFCFPGASARVESDGSTSWIVVDKEAVLD
jgi:demethylmenaquinone methyltransferase/2-methoxy-6-polyprenyl-1,4-benzoquinol methylase